jgi:hypothetical protein
MPDEAPYAVRAALRRHYEREAAAPLGVTLRRLLRSDADRLRFWDGRLTVANVHVERKYVDREDERIAIEAAQLDGTLTPAFGYVVTAGSRPQESAWLIDGNGNVIDPARRVRDVQGYLGVALRRAEAAHWTPSQPDAVGERAIHRQRLVA